MNNNKISNLHKTFSTNYSGNNQIDNEKINSNKKNMFNNSYSTNVNSQENKMYNNNYGNYTKDTNFHEYKGMDGRIYYTKESLDIANRLYLENKNK